MSNENKMSSGVSGRLVVLELSSFRASRASPQTETQPPVLTSS